MDKHTDCDCDNNPEWSEPEIGWEQYFINAFLNESIIKEVLDHIEDYDLEIKSFDTKWLEYDYNGDLKDED